MLFFGFLNQLKDSPHTCDITDKRDDDCEFKRYDFYPGQVLSGQLKDFELANFTFCSEEMKNLRNASNSKMKSCNLKAAVDKVKVTSVTVNWQCQVGEGNQGISEFRSNFFFYIEYS